MIKYSESSASADFFSCTSLILIFLAWKHALLNGVGEGTGKTAVTSYEHRQKSDQTFYFLRKISQINELLSIIKSFVKDNFFFFLSSTRKFGIWLLYQWSKRSLTRMQNSSTKEKKGQFTLGEPRHSRRRASKAATGIVCKSESCTDEVEIIDAAGLVPQKHAHTSRSVPFLLHCRGRMLLSWLVWIGESQVKK